MKIYPIEAVIPETNIIFFSPHYDDFLFVLGGYVNALKVHNLLNTKRFEIKMIFSRSNYQARQGKSNFDPSDERIKFATGNRLIEDMNCNDELLGQFNYSYELYGERECFTRGKAPADSEMEFPHGMYDNFNENDWAIFERLKDRIRILAKSSDTALVFPIAIKEHIDHFILREAAINVAQEVDNQAVFYFHEDKPYGGIATDEELARTENFINTHQLHSKLYHFDPELMIDLAFKHYVSQVEEVYKTGIRNRAEYWRKELSSDAALDRVCVFDINKEAF
jgi:hypothetical protein